MFAVLAAAIVAASSPFVGEINTAMERTFPGQYFSIVISAVVLPAVVAVIIAIFRIREHRRLRYGLLTVAVALAVLYATVMQTTPTEQFHFTEYGVLALLFYRAWRWREDVTVLVLPACAALTTGVTDEWFQWFVPSRVGEARDVALNGIGVLCGLLVAVALQPPRRVTFRVESKARQALATGITVLLLGSAYVFQTIHLGYEIRDAEIGLFRSHFNGSALSHLVKERGERWRHRLPIERRSLISREDHYFSEALFHVEWRNRAVGRGDNWTAWNENLILEKFYTPVVESPLMPFRWPPEQRAAVSQATSANGTYISNAYPLPVYLWNRGLYWGLVAAAISTLWIWATAKPVRPLEAVAF